MARIVFNRQNEIDFPTFLLQNRNFDTICEITEVHDFVYKENLNGANEASFCVYKYRNGILNSCWDDIIEHTIVYIPEFQERFELTVSLHEEGELSKQCTLKSLCEAELSQIILRNIEINTKNDIDRKDYDTNFPTVFYRDPENLTKYESVWDKEGYKNYSSAMKKQTVRNSSLLHRLLSDKAPHYEIGHVDESLHHIQRTFSFSDTDIYSTLTGEISNEFHCIFLFDSVNRKINVYDLYNTCNNCGYRGDFTDECPECHDTGHNFGGQYGLDTTIFIDKENLADNITLETNADAIKNCFYVEGGDEVINATFRSINPNGSQYIYHNSESMKKNMPSGLLEKLSAYDKIYNEYQKNHVYNINESGAVDNYNSVVRYVKKHFQESEYEELADTITGYPALTDVLYKVIDLYGFINDGMMPTIDTDGLDIDKSLKAIVTGLNNNTIILENPDNAIQSTVENIIIKTAKLYYSTAYYDIEISTTEYTKSQSSSQKKGTWKGNITLTSLTEKNEQDNYITNTSDQLSVTIPYESDKTEELREKYIRQQIEYAISGRKSLSQKQIASFSLEETDFKENLHLYSLSELNNLWQMFESCLDVILTLDRNEETKKLLDKYHNFYHDRKGYIEAEVKERQIQLDHIKALYYFDSSTMDSPTGILYELRKQTQDDLDIRNFLGIEMYRVFCSYRREDTYSNKNYISDGMSNTEVIQITKQLYAAASEELRKASSPQYTISASMHNLLAMKEFHDIRDRFAVGNWIRLGVNDEVYRLRLLSYQIHFDDIQSINVEFSTAEKLGTPYNDIKDVLESASSMASSYSYVANQVKAADEINSHVKNWISNGFNATNTMFANNENQEVLMDEHGILLRKTLPDMDNQYEPFQARFLSNGLYFTSDNWENIETGIGKFTYYDPEKNGIVKDYGLIAKTVVGKLMLGENLRLYNKDGSLKFTENGLEITNGTNTFTVNPNNKKFFTLSTISNGEKKDILSTDGNGNLTISGALTSDGAITGGTISIDNNFSVNEKGALSAKSVNLSGNLIAENLKVKNNIVFYLDDVNKYSKMISIEKKKYTEIDGVIPKFTDIDTNTTITNFYDLVLGKKSRTVLYEDEQDNQNYAFYGIILKGNVQVPEHLEVKDLNVNQSMNIQGTMTVNGKSIDIIKEISELNAEIDILKHRLNQLEKPSNIENQTGD